MELHSATAEDVLSARVTDVYFRRTRQILEAFDLDPHVRAEFVAKSLPSGWDWAVFAGLDEVLELASELGVTVRGMPEGTLFGPLEPVLEVSGRYRDFCEFETALLGLMCQSTGVATAAARCRKAAGARPVISFGGRRLHPTVAPVVERAAYVGGCDGVATVAGADLIGEEPIGTIPHALVLLIGDTTEATRAFHEVIDEAVPRVSLIDTFHDEKFEAVAVAEELGEALDSVRLDTPSTRKGDFYRLLEEVRWELDIRGHTEVDLFVSGGIDEEKILDLNDLADGYGVGGAISAAPIVDFAMDVVEIEGEAAGKRGKWSGAKEVFGCVECGARRIGTLGSEPPSCDCGAATERLLRSLVEEGERVHPGEDPQTIRARVVSAVQDLPPLKAP